MWREQVTYLNLQILCNCAPLEISGSKSCLLNNSESLWDIFYEILYNYNA